MLADVTYLAKYVFTQNRITVVYDVYLALFIVWCDATSARQQQVASELAAARLEPMKSGAPIQSRALDKTLVILFVRRLPREKLVGFHARADPASTYGRGTL